MFKIQTTTMRPVLAAALPIPNLMTVERFTMKPLGNDARLIA